MEQKFWIEKSKLNEIKWVKKYNLACDKWSKLTPNQIAIKYSYFSVNEHRKFINEICEKLNISLKGKGLEIGSGPGILSNSLIKIFNDIDKIYLLEMVPNSFSLMKKVAKFNNTEKKLSCIIGDFNNLKFKDESLDFIVEFDAIHHSDDFDRTFKEISRVLKPGGILLCFDRGHPNYISSNQINDMLDIEYSDDYKKENNIALKKKYTRRMNGEHEPLIKDWINTGKKYKLSNSISIFYSKSFKHFLRSLYGLIVPYWMKKKLNKGINITTHYQIILGYLNINKSKELKTYSLNYKSKNKKSPNAKMVFLFEKS